MLCHHKAPHREWSPDAKHAKLYDDTDIPKPPTFDDDYSGRGTRRPRAGHDDRQDPRPAPT